MNNAAWWVRWIGIAFWAVFACGGASCRRNTERAPGSSAVAESPRGTTVNLRVTEDGFVPNELTGRVGEELELSIVRTTEQTCATEILIEGTPINVPLPLNTATVVRYRPPRAGRVRFGCAMEMMVGGVIDVAP